MANLPPLSLYIHIPWCVQKCPYCDFNSHALKGEVPHDDYVQHLLNDLRADAHYAQGREIGTIFIGGGTPSLLSGTAMQTLLDGVRESLPLASNAEITMEANPGTVEADRFVEYQRAGINRISIGVQSFSEQKLQRLGRIHGPQEARRAANLASGLGLRSFNLDLMHGLPDQSLEEALDDLRQAIALNPPHQTPCLARVRQPCRTTTRCGTFMNRGIACSVRRAISNMKPPPTLSRAISASIT